MSEETVTLIKAARNVLASGRLARFTTVAEDERPPATIVWGGLDGNDIVIGRLPTDQRLANITRGTSCKRRGMGPWVATPH